MYFVKEHCTNSWGYYITQKGDTLGQLSELFYQKSNFWIVLAGENSFIDLYQSSTPVAEGMEILIPSSKEASEYFPWEEKDKDDYIYISSENFPNKLGALTHFNELVKDEKDSINPREKILEFKLYQVYEDKASKRYYFPLKTGGALHEYILRGMITAGTMGLYFTMINGDFATLLYMRSWMGDASPWRHAVNSKLSQRIVASASCQEALHSGSLKDGIIKRLDANKKTGSFNFPREKNRAFNIMFGRISWSVVDPITEKPGPRLERVQTIYLYDVFNFERSKTRGGFGNTLTTLGRGADYTNFITIIEVMVTLPEWVMV